MSSYFGRCGKGLGFFHTMEVVIDGHVIGVSEERYTTPLIAPDFLTVGATASNAAARFSMGFACRGRHRLAAAGWAKTLVNL
jgi:hypothetical protein